MAPGIPSAFGRATTNAMLDRITFGVQGCSDATESVDRLLLNLATALKILKGDAEAHGYNAQTVGIGLDAMIEALEREGHKITSAVCENTELDV